MEYDRREPLQGVSGWESTAVTKMSVKQLLAREGSFEALTQKLGMIPKEVHQRAAAKAAADAEASPLKQPPHMQGKLPSKRKEDKVQALKAEALPPVEEAHAEEPRSLFQKILWG